MNTFFDSPIPRSGSARPNENSLFAINDIHPTIPQPITSNDINNVNHMDEINQTVANQVPPSRATTNSIPISVQPNEAEDTHMIPSSSSPDSDVKEILKDVDGVEERVAEAIASVHKQLTQCTNYMMDCISAGFAQRISKVRTEMKELKRKRKTNRKIVRQMRGLESLDSDQI